MCLSDKVKHRIAKEVAENGLGVRYLKSVILHLPDDRMFENPDMDVYVIRYNGKVLAPNTLPSESIIL